MGKRSNSGISKGSNTYQDVRKRLDNLNKLPEMSTREAKSKNLATSKTIKDSNFAYDTKEFHKSNGTNSDLYTVESAFSGRTYGLRENGEGQYELVDKINNRKVIEFGTYRKPSAYNISDEIDFYEEDHDYNSWS